MVGPDLSLLTMAKAMLEGEDKWRAVASFCGTVMSQKEAAERLRRGENPPAQQRAGRAGARAYNPRPRLRAHLGA